MSTTILTSAWEAVILNFSPVFTQPTAQIFINLITGWILCTTRRTVTGIMPFAEPKGNRPHDAYHRLFPKSRWLPSHLWKLLAQMLIEMFYPAGTVWMDMDDTIFHRTGRKVHSTAKAKAQKTRSQERPSAVYARAFAAREGDRTY